jgi:hypothetical protein
MKGTLTVMAARIESYITPTTLYRYRELKKFDRELSAIKKATLYCGPYKDLNDPMEGFYSSSPRLRESDSYSRIRQVIADEKSKLGICSFSEVHNNELMWAHYADEYRGICIAYSFNSLRHNLGDDVEFVRMSYSDKAPTLHSKETSEYLAKRALSSKNYKWLYEREWRMFASTGVISYHRDRCVSCVYLGSRIDPEHSRLIRHEMKSLGIQTKSMSLERYSMSFVTCEE